ncbi:phage antirepressor KilAC domain-containing protein [Dysgonomonas sp. 521]|uniref:phage antirepressor KilAC domain-containing protein n=1 Tax=Dysgonomonas sp. 521 TaxID=2302932 RepID=UPI001C88DEDF|nr:phage antirepressor KilAC domain-containing protein [Dysgonomonas sp. 521]
MTATKLEKFNQKTISSREIAEITGKTHDNVLKAIRNMEDAWARITGVKFNVSDYKDSTGRKLPMYELSKTESLYVATKFNDEARAKLILRWEELELKAQKIALPQSYSEALRELADKAEENERLKIEAKENAPKVLFTNAVSAAKTSILIGELAKILKQNGVEIGQNRLFEWLRQNNYLISRKGTDYNAPTQRAMDLGLFEIKETVVTHSDHTTINKTTKVTGKGQIYFINKFLAIEV